VGVGPPFGVCGRRLASVNLDDHSLSYRIPREEFCGDRRCMAARWVVTKHCGELMVKSDLPTMSATKTRLMYYFL
jgi:hypothetical protein